LTIGAGISESVVEEALLEWFSTLDYAVVHGPDIAPGTSTAERDDYRDVVLAGRLRDAVHQLNPELPIVAIEEAMRKVLRPGSASTVLNNRRFHRMLVDGVDVEVSAEGGGVRGRRVRLVDFADATANDWLVVNQFTVQGPRQLRRPDVVVFLNGLPLGLVELKDPADEDATIQTAFAQVETYKGEFGIPAIFDHNEVLVISDGSQARLGSVTAPWEWFLPWRTIEGEELASPLLIQLEVLIRGVFDHERFLDLLQSFIVFEDDGGKITKKIAVYHQFHATRRAVETTLQASSPEGDRRGGVVWHTQGSGKSLTMGFFAGKLIRHPVMANPTIVVLTDRIDLDDQLFGVFSRCQELLRQAPVQATNRAHLRDLLNRPAGGVVFTTIQKFLPEEKGDRFPTLSARRNIVVLADEAHRSQYDFIDGFAKHMRDALPNATFVGFTGTPIELDDRDTRAVFGDYISIYDVKRAVEDRATVPIYYESRLARLDLKPEEKPHLDEGFEEITEGEEESRRERLKTRWAALESVVGTERRLGLIAKDLVEHFEGRLATMDGKAMVVCMSRRICVDLYNEIVRLRPEWHSDEDGRGSLKVVMTGSAPDPSLWQPHIRNKPRREALAQRFKDPADPFRIVIVRDMWLTGFDAPSLHTMYVDKPMRGHGLMQAIARVNRVFRDKPGGLVVDYLGLADSLKQALAVYSESGGKGRAAIDQSEAIAKMLELYEICQDLFHGFDYSRFLSGTASQRMNLLPYAEQHVLEQEDGKDRLIQAVVELSKAFALAVPSDEAIAIRDEVAFFQTVKAGLVKAALTRERPQEELDHAIRQIIAGAIAPEGVVDIFAAAGLAKPEISLLSEEFLAEVREMPQRNLAMEVLERLLNDEIKARARKNLVQSRAFSEMLEETILRYKNRAVSTAQVIEELIQIARELRDVEARGEDLGLSPQEVAFYDALATNESAVQVLGDETLRIIAREVADVVRKNTTIDWTVRESARANLRRLVRRVLGRHGYPPDKWEAATQTVLEQAQLFGFELVGRQ
jgi:type I restriction enzyme R subunit